ncbi:MAG: hypothetical protein H6727_09260 [Myxococcales bacterium]|nr:hypothetical protein [Myxococcales bacterium]
MVSEKKRSGAAYCIYRNLHTGGWSLKYKGKVLERLPAEEAILFQGQVFPRVEESGRKRAITEGQRNVHSYLCTQDEKPNVMPHADYAREMVERLGFRRVSYSPFTSLNWHFVDTQKPFAGASNAILLGGREVWVPPKAGYKENPGCPKFLRRRLKRYYYIRHGRLKPDWLEDLQAGDIVRLSPHESVGCNYTIHQLDKDADHIEYTDRTGKKRKGKWSTFLDALKKAWKEELDTFIRKGIERREQILAKAKKHGSNGHIERAKKELVRFKAAYDQDGLKADAPTPEPEALPVEERPKTNQKKTSSKKASISQKTGHHSTTRGSFSTETGEVKAEEETLQAHGGWRKADNIRVATYAEGEHHGGFETHGFKKGAITYYKNADGMWEVMHKESGLRLHTLQTEFDAQMFGDQALTVKIPPAKVLLDTKSKNKVRLGFLEHIESLKRTQEMIQQLAQMASLADVETIEESDEEEPQPTTAYLWIGEEILAWWNESKRDIQQGRYPHGGDLASCLKEMQLLASMERERRTGKKSVRYPDLARQREKVESFDESLQFLRTSFEGLTPEAFPNHAKTEDFSRVLIQILFSGWSENPEVQDALRDLANLHLPIEEIEPLLNVSNHGELPVWIYLYHAERIGQSLGQSIHLESMKPHDTARASGLLGGAIQLWKQFHAPKLENKGSKAKVSTQAKAQPSPKKTYAYFEPLYTITDEEVEWTGEIGEGEDKEEVPQQATYHTIQHRDGKFIVKRDIVTGAKLLKYQNEALQEWAEDEDVKEWRRVTKMVVKSGSDRQLLFEQKSQKHSKDEALQRCESFLATEEAERPNLTGVYFDGDGSAWGTDGHRMITLPTSYRKSEVISQRKEDGRTRKIRVGDFPYTQVRDIYDQILLSKKYQVMVLNAKNFGDNVRIINDVLRKLSMKHVALGVEKDGVYLEVVSKDSTNEKKAKTRKHFRIYVGPAPVDIQSSVSYFNITFLEQALQGAVGSAELRLNHTDRTAPLLLRRQDGEEHVIMPVNF